MVTQEVRHNVKVGLSHSLKFIEVEASAGGIEFGFAYSELQPIIRAAGVGEALPSWDYTQAKGLMVQGAQSMHLLVKVPGGMTPVRATLDLAADVCVRNSRLPVVAIRDRKRADDHLSVEPA